MELLLIPILLLAALAIPLIIICIIGRLVFEFVLRVRRGKEHAQETASQWRLVAFFAATAYIAYSVFAAIYPEDDFYLSELKEVTLLDPTDDAKVVAGSASYPTFTGDYCSFARIFLGVKSYGQLLLHLEGDNQFYVGDGFLGSEEKAVHRIVAPIRVSRSFVRRIENRPDRNYTIQFLDDKAHVEVAVCRM